MSRTMALHVRYKYLYIPLPSSTQQQQQQQREMTKSCVFLWVRTTAANLLYSYLELTLAIQLEQVVRQIRPLDNCKIQS